MAKSTDLAGFKVGKLTVIELAYKKQLYYRNGKKAGWNYFYRCKCECGKETIVVKNRLTCRKKPTLSCGCLHQGHYKHGGCGTRLFEVYRAMIQRCSKPYDKRYESYGGRGITVCTEWESNYINFYNWAMSNGYDENAPFGQCTLDRIDIDGNYEPSNCRWISMKEQARNTRRNNYITYKNKKYTITDLAKLLGTYRNTILRHQRQGTLSEYIKSFDCREE